VLCSVVKHLGSVEHSRSREKHSTTSHPSPYTSFVLTASFTTEQPRALSRLLYLLNKGCFYSAARLTVTYQQTFLQVNQSGCSTDFHVTE